MKTVVDPAAVRVVAARELLAELARILEDHPDRTVPADDVEPLLDQLTAALRRARSRVRRAQKAEQPATTPATSRPVLLDVIRPAPLRVVIPAPRPLPGRPASQTTRTAECAERPTGDSHQSYRQSEGTPMTHPNMSAPDHRSRRRTPLITGGVLAFLVLIVTIAVFASRRDSEPQATNTTTAATTTRPTLDAAGRQACQTFLNAIEQKGQDIGSTQERLELAMTVNSLAVASSSVEVRAGASFLPSFATATPQEWRAAAAVFMETCHELS